MLEDEIKEVNTFVVRVHDRGEGNPRLLAMAVEINQRYIDLLEAIWDGLIRHDADWVAERMTE